MLLGLLQNFNDHVILERFNADAVVDVVFQFNVHSVFVVVDVGLQILKEVCLFEPFLLQEILVVRLERQINVVVFHKISELPLLQVDENAISFNLQQGLVHVAEDSSEFLVRFYFLFAEKHPETFHEVLNKVIDVACIFT